MEENQCSFCPWGPSPDISNSRGPHPGAQEGPNDFLQAFRVAAAMSTLLDREASVAMPSQQGKAT